MPVIKNKTVLAAIEVGSAKIKMMAAVLEEDGSLTYIGHKSNNTSHVANGLPNDDRMVGDDIYNVIHLFMSQFDIEVIEHLALSFSAEIQPQTGSESLYLNGRSAAEACVELYGILSNQRRPGYETMELNGYEFFVDNRKLLSLDSRKSEGSQLSMRWLKVDIKRETYRAFTKIFHNYCPIAPDLSGFSGCTSSLAIDPETYRVYNNVLVIDMGKGTTDFVVMKKNSAMRFVRHMPAGLDFVHTDVAAALGISPVHAEKICVKYGKALADSENIQTIEEKLMRTRVTSFSSWTLEMIIETRLRELFDFIWNEISSEPELPQSIDHILLNGGITHLPLVCELLQSVTGKSVDFATLRSVRGIEAFEDKEVNLNQYAPCLGSLVKLKGKVLEERHVERNLFRDFSARFSNALTEVKKAFSNLDF